jgi:hypothetical protein
MAEDLPGGFYENIDRKNWTVNVIQHGLSINNELYTIIYTAIETEMRSQNILGNKLNQSLVKKQLKLILDNIILRFSTTFDTIPLLWREKCLMAIAQKCNYNMRRSMRRRTTISGSPKHRADSMCQDVTKPPQDITEPPPSMGEPADEPKTDKPKPFRIRTLESIMVFITMATSERCTICRMVDFVMQGSSGNLTIESLAFDRFTSILKEDIQFDSNEHNIFYRCTKGMAVAITNERSWKAAIGDMYTGSMDSFDFYVEKKGEYMSGHSLAYF